jgi:FMN reductase
MTRRVVAVTAGLTNPSSTRLLTDQIAEAVTAQVTARGEAVEVTVVELRELAGELAAYMASGGMPTQRISEVRELVDAADGLVAVSPVFSASYSGLFKMFFDALDPDSLTGVPVLIGATAGSARHSLVLDHAMRPLFTYLRAVVVPTGVFAATEDFGGDTGLTERIARAASELAALLVASDAYSVGGFGPDLSHAPRRRSGDDLDDVTPFGDLLRGHSG